MPRSRDAVAAMNAQLASTSYRAIELIGRGSMGEVFRVEETFLGKQFALKALRGTVTAELIDRIRIEAQAAARLRHPNVVRVTDFVLAANGAPCMVMELLRGHTLAREITLHAPLAPAIALTLAWATLSGLSAAHALGITHRDIKPENLFLHEVPTQGRVLKVLDFGLARVLQGGHDRTPAPLFAPTITGTLVGSPRFQSPEALRGERVDARADVYAVGLILYEMLTARGAFDLGNVPRPPSELAPRERPGPKISGALDRSVLRAIEEAAGDRYQSADEFRAALQVHLATALGAYAESAASAIKGFALATTLATTPKGAQ